MPVALKSSGGGSVTVDVASTASDYTQTLVGATATLAPLVYGTPQNSTSGTSVDFTGATGVPSWAKRITLMFNGVSVNTTTDIIVQLGTSGGFVTSGYSSVASRISSTGAANVTTTNGFNVTGGMGSATNLVFGAIQITNFSGNTWVEGGVLTTTTGVSYNCPSGGLIALAAALTQVRVTTANGVDLFDAGSITIMFE